MLYQITVHLKISVSTSLVKALTLTVWPMTQLFHAHALVSKVTLRTGTNVATLCAVTRHPLLTGVGIARI